MADPDTAARIATSMYLLGRKAFVTGRVLDVGCGRMPYKRMFASCEWVGLDKRPVGDIEADMHKTELDDESFDTIVCTDVLHLTPSPVSAITEMARVLKPGGHIVVVTRTTPPTGEDVYLGIHPAALGRMLISAGLAGVDLMPEGRLISQEWAEVTGFDKYHFSMPPTIGDWCEQMDRRYPAITGAVAKKE